MYIIHYDICALFISALSIVFSITNKGIRKKQNKILFALIIVIMLTAAFDIPSAIINDNITPSLIVLCHLLNYAYLISQNILPYLLYVYIVINGALDKKTVNNKKLRYISVIPFLIEAIVILTNPFTGFVYYYNDNLEYTHGPGIYILYGLALVYIIMCFVLLFRFSKSFTKSKKIMIMVFLSATITAVIVQMFILNLLIQLCIESLCALGLLFTVDNETELTDRTTTCYNRQSFLNDNSLYMQNNIRYFVLILKIADIEKYNASIGIFNVNNILNKIGIWLRSADKSKEVYYCNNGSYTVICSKEEDITVLKSIIEHKFQKPWKTGEISIRPNISVTTVNFPKEVHDLEELMSVIDNNIESASTKQILDNHKMELSIIQAIERAMKNGGLSVVYQPIWNASNNKITVAEALLRLVDDELGEIPPSEFIPIAEKRGLISELGKFVFESVCSFCAEYSPSSIGIEHIGINLSSAECINDKLAETYSEIAEKYNVDKSFITFELDNDIMINKDVEYSLLSLQLKGFRIGINSFGTEKSSFSSLYSFKYDIVKINKNYIPLAENNTEANIVISHLIKLIHELNSKVSFVGVETSEQKSYVQSLNCDYIQGYYYSPALPVQEFLGYCTGFNTK